MLGIFESQVCLLNKIAIGQFLCMKYKVLNKKNILNNNGADISSLSSLACESIIEPITIIAPIEAKNTPPNAVGYLSFNEIPLLSKKPSSLLKVSLEALTAINGTPRIVTHEEIAAPVGYCLPNWKVTNQPIVIPNQNIKFQKLSWVQRDLSQLIKLLIFKVTRLILPCFGLSHQVKLMLLMIFLLFLSTNAMADDHITKLIKKIEYQYNIPSGLLLALADVESAYQPYALNMAGKSVISDSIEQAKHIAEKYLQKGTGSIDIGVMQLNYFWHGKNFASVSEMLVPKKNINYAAQLLTSLYKQHGSWQKAVQHYHSATPKYHRQYSQKVLSSWLRG